jgi:outer membrane protein assembly factor BamB/Tfp pilus assembly protein PilF
MGFQGQLSSVNLTDIFQTLQMNRQTGTLSVTSPSGTQLLYFDAGQIAMASAPPVDGRPYLLNALLRKNLVTQVQADEIQGRAESSHQPLRELLLSSNLVGETELDEVSAWCIEELACPIFEWQEGEFSFTDGAPFGDLTGPNVATMGRIGLATTQLVLEATRRKDEWKRIHEVITDPNALYVVDNDGRNNLRNLQTDPEMLKVLRYLDGRHTLDEIAAAVGVTKFDTFAITAQLVLAGVARPRSAEEIVADAEALRRGGELEQAKVLLENILSMANVPEVIRPLAEICAQLKQAPRAVELYLELIQIAQDQGDLEQARADLDTVLALSPDDPDLQFDRAKVLSELGSMEEAAAAYVAAAQAYIGTRDTGRAIDACHRAKNLLPRSPDPHRFLAKAYLMDGQTENALVEYKSLWHALLTAERPRRAIEILRATLEADCRFSNIKEQVLSHAQNSEAIKTSKAMRVLVYVVIGLLMVGAAGAGFNYYQTHVRVAQANAELDRIKLLIPDKERAGLFSELFEDLKGVRTNFGGTAARTDIDALEADLHRHYEARAEEQVKLAKELLGAGQRDQAVLALNTVRARFPGTPGDEEAKALLAAAAEGQIIQDARTVLDAAQRRWTALEWDAALAELQPLLQAKLPKSIAGEIAAVAADWNAKIESAKDLFERAERFEQSGRRREALEAFARAAKGKGEQYVARARERLAALEVDFAKDTAQAALKAFERGEDKQAFALLDELKGQGQRASSKGVSDYAARLELPFTVKVDSHLATLVIKRQGLAEQTVHAPPGTRGPWSHRLTYLPGDSVAVEARRPGFTTQTLPISFQGRRSQAAIVLARGPLWQTDLGAVPVTAPVPTAKFVLVGTNKGTLEVVDTGLGSSRPVVFPATVDEFKAPPLVFQNLAYVVLENRLHVIDIATHNELWKYPAGDQDSPLRLTGSLWVQEHELIPGQVLVFLGAAKGEVLTYSVDGRKLIVYPKTALPGELSGALVGDQYEPNHTILYAPAGNQLCAFDTTGATEKSSPTALYNLRTRGEVIGRLVRSTAAGRPALLAIDNSGLLVAIDANPGVPDLQRAFASWAIDGTGTGIACQPGRAVAYVGIGEGRVVAADLAKPGQLAWRFPAQGSIGALNAPPVIGLHGIYVADAAGILHCIDAQNGAERWRAELGSPASAGILASDGRIYVPTRGGMLACFEEGDE